MVKGRAETLACGVVLGLSAALACGESETNDKAKAETDANGGSGGERQATGGGGGAVNTVAVGGIDVSAATTTGPQTTTGGTGFITSGAAGAVATTGGMLVNDCEPHVTDRDVFCTLDYLCDEEEIRGDCFDHSDDGGNIHCGCVQSDRYLSFELDDSQSFDAACSSIIDWCYEGDLQAEVSGARDCELLIDYTNLDECYSEIECGQDGVLDGMEVTVLEVANLQCFFSQEDQGWNCDCGWQDSSEEVFLEEASGVEVDDELAQQACEQAFLECTD